MINIPQNMKLSSSKWIGITLAVMFILPLIVAKCVPSDCCGMVVCFVLFFIVNPFYSLLIGVYAGRNIKTRWGMPVFSAAVIQLGTWLFFDFYAPEFLKLTGAYMCIGIVSMLIKKQRIKSNERSKSNGDNESLRI